MNLKRRKRQQGVCLLEALILLLLCLLAAGLTFYLGRKIVDWLRELQRRRDQQIREASGETTNELSRTFYRHTGGWKS